MSAISVIGLGSMGGALARTLQTAGYDVTVWNRTPQKMQPYLSNGATGASSLAEAVQASPVTLVCVDNYGTTRRLLAAEDVFPHLRGRTLIQLSTGTPQDARDFAAWLAPEGISYLDGAILGSPGSVGTQNVHLMFAGDKAVFDQCQPLLDCLGPVDYVGENIGAASAFDLVRLSLAYGVIVGSVHGARILESEQLGLDRYNSLFAGRPYMWLMKNIQDEAYADPPATVEVWNDALLVILRQAQTMGINSEFPEFVSGLFERTIQAGYGQEDVAALVKVLRSDT